MVNVSHTVNKDRKRMETWEHVLTQGKNEVEGPAAVLVEMLKSKL